MSGPYTCGGNEYRSKYRYDLREHLDRFAFEKKLDIFMGWFEEADEIMADKDSGHRHFIVGELEVECNIQKISDRFREVYWTVTPLD